MDIASVLQQVQGISLNFCGMNLSWVPSEVGGIDIIVPIVAGISAWLLCVAQNAANVIQAEQSLSLIHISGRRLALVARFRVLRPSLAPRPPIMATT